MANFIDPGRVDSLRGLHDRGATLRGAARALGLNRATVQTYFAQFSNDKPMKSESKRTPSADDVAIAIIVSARAYDENPEAVARGDASMESRRAAMCALEIVFPQAPKPMLVRLVGGGLAFLQKFERGVPRSERQKRFSVQWRAADCVAQGTLFPVTALNMRRAVVSDAENVTADLMGDPPPGRSALRTLPRQCEDNAETLLHRD